jgi:hypothetical protein
MIEDCLFCRCRGVSSLNTRKTTASTKRTIIYHPRSLNTRNTATSTKQTIIYLPNITPRTQETPRHLQNKQSSSRDVSCVQGVKIIYDCSFCRCRGVSCVQGVRMIDACSFCRCRGHSCVQGVRMIDDCSFCRCRGLIILTPLTQERPRHLQNKQSSIILTP